MVCQTANEVQARLALRALWPPPGKATDGDNGTDPPTGHVSKLQRQLRAEMEDVLQASLQRRLKRIEQKVNVLCSDGGVNMSSSPTPSVAASGVPLGSSVAVQTEDPQAAQRLVTVLERTLKPAEAKQKAYGPSGRQSRLLDPSEEKVDGPVNENKCIKNSLDELDRNLNSRERQIEALSRQLETCRSMYKEKEDATMAAAEVLRELVHHPAAAPKIHEERVRKLRQRVAELRQNLDRSQEKAVHYQSLSQQQRRYYLQNERIGLSNAGDRVQRHPAGDIFLVPQPPPMGDAKPEVFDIGTAIANPYICDSWPFEPNVLAQRTSKEATLPACIEEMKEDLRDDPFHDRYFGGPPETARSV